MRVDCLRKQSLNLRQCKDGFCKSIALHLSQIFHSGSHALHGGTTGDEPVSALSPFAFLTVGNPVFILLHLVLKLNKLPFTGGTFVFQVCYLITPCLFSFIFFYKLH